MTNQEALRPLVETHERWLAQTPPTSQKARADRIAWSRLIYRSTPRGPERRAARRRYRAEVKAFEQAHFAENPRSSIRVVLLTAPFGFALGLIISVVLR